MRQHTPSMRSGGRSPQSLLACAGVVVVSLGVSRPALAQFGTSPTKADAMQEAKQLETKQLEAKGDAAIQSGEQKAPGADVLVNDQGEELIELSGFTDAVELSTLVEFVATTLQVNITVKGDLQGSVVFNAPVPVKKSELIALLDMFLDQYGWTITREQFGIYVVQPAGGLLPSLAGDTPTTRVIPTPNIRPSALKAALDGQLGGAASGANPAMQGGAGGVASAVSYLDELGVIVATDAPRRLDMMERLVRTLIDEYEKADFIRLDLVHISAPVARERALQLIGQIAQPLSTQPGQQGQPNFQPGQQPGATPTGSLNNLGDRLTVDPQGNALIFRGLPEEITSVKRILAIIDAPNELVPKQYFAGSAAKQIADIARGQGLGEVTTIAAPTTGPVYNYNYGGEQGQQPGQGTKVGGPVMVVDEGRGTIVYYGTQQQQDRLAALIKELDTNSEKIVIEVYKLRNSNAEDMAEVIQNLISGTLPQGEGELLPDRRSTARTSGQPVTFNPITGQPQTEGGVSLDDSGFVLADLANNQVLVKARKGQQVEFARLIQKLDQRRPQVYVEARIVAVTTDDRTRLAFESQLIEIGGQTIALGSSFGIAGRPTSITGRLNPVLTNGFSAAIIKSDQVPLVMTALANETDSRVIATPQLLVDDNEEAEVVTADQQPTTSISRGSNGSNDVVTSGEPAEARTSLRVTPQISNAGYLRLNYEIELSSFTGEGQTIGETRLAPPKQTNTIKSESVTVPSDSTVVIGGLVVESKTGTVAKVPLLGDIPIVGKLFRDESKGDRRTMLYVFLTPRILRDPGFEDLRLLTEGPQSAAKLRADLPSIAPAAIPINMQPGVQPAGRMPPGQSPINPAPMPSPAASAPRGEPVLRPVTPVPVEGGK